jgi:hypothetical protein
MSGQSFFGLVSALLDEEGTVSLRELLDRGGAEKVYGLALALLSVLSFVPGVANVIALAIIGLGVQMVAGKPYPWLPGRVLRYELHRGRIKTILTKVEGQLRRLGPRRLPPRPIPQRLLGLLVTWTALLLSLPILLPFANVLPAAALLLMGIALLEDWPYAAWLGLAGSLATTVYFILSFDLVLKGLRAALHFRHIFE